MKSKKLCEKNRGVYLKGYYILINVVDNRSCLNTTEGVIFYLKKLGSFDIKNHITHHMHLSSFPEIFGGGWN